MTCQLVGDPQAASVKDMELTKLPGLIGIVIPHTLSTDHPQGQMVHGPILGHHLLSSSEQMTTGGVVVCR